MFVRVCFYSKSKQAAASRRARDVRERAKQRTKEDPGCVLWYFTAMEDNDICPGYCRLGRVLRYLICLNGFHISQHADKRWRAVITSRITPAARSRSIAATGSVSSDVLDGLSPASATDSRQVVIIYPFKECSEAVIPVRLAVLQLTRAGAVVDPAAAAAHLDGVVHPARQGLAAPVPSLPHFTST